MCNVQKIALRVRLRPIDKGTCTTLQCINTCCMSRCFMHVYACEQINVSVPNTFQGILLVLAQLQDACTVQHDGAKMFF